MQLTRSSGDLLADKRFAYAEALVAEGDLAAAVDLYEQAASLAPQWAPVHLAWGLALQKLGRGEQAEAVLARAERLDHDGTLGAALHRARLVEKPVETLPTSYVAALFDQYAPRFDEHLTAVLAYRGPDIILQRLARLGRSSPDGATLDLGCGTGLMARALGSRGAAAIDGIDLSAAMVARARETGLYRTLLVGECVATMNELADDGYALVLAADVLVYFGDLAPILTQVARVLASGGLFAATAQTSDRAEFALGDDLRFRHSPAYIRNVLSGVGLDVLALDPCVTRQEGGRDVPGLVFVGRVP